MAAVRGEDARPSSSTCADGWTADRPDVLTPQLIRNLLDDAQSGGSGRVAELCAAWCRANPPPADLERFQLLVVLFVCAQVDRSSLDVSEIVEQMKVAAEASGSDAAQATAHASRALSLATRGRYAQAMRDLGRAAVLLELRDAELPSDESALLIRRLACNTMAVALTRQGVFDAALHWVREFDRTHPEGPEGAAGRCRAAFAEAWIQFTRALDPDPEHRDLEVAEQERFRGAANGFRAAADSWPDHPSDPVVVSARRLIIATSILAGEMGGAEELRLAVDGSVHQRPDHRAVCQLALARVDVAGGDSTSAVARLDDALASLPAEHAFRSVAVRLMWEKAAVSFHGWPTSQQLPVRSLLGVLFRDRREERFARAAAYASAVDEERQRVVLLADRDRAQMDPLTGLAARSTLDDHLRHVLEVVALEQVPAVVAFIDLDGFKVVNDQMSHLSGDRVLAIFGALIRETMCRRDVAVRYGGDEFVLVFVGQDAAAVRLLLGRLRTAFAATTQLDVGTTVTFSAGVVDVVVGSAADAVLFEADRAMLAGKRAGRDTVVTGFVRRTEH